MRRHQVALIKLTGGSDLLLVVDAGYNRFHVFSCIFQSRSEPPSLQFSFDLVPVWTSIWVLLGCFGTLFSIMNMYCCSLIFEDFDIMLMVSDTFSRRTRKLPII